VRPRISPKNTILMAASLLPLANPVHEMVMPEVGRTPIKKNPTAQSAYFSATPEKKKPAGGIRQQRNEDEINGLRCQLKSGVAPF
jgi:hypothetical protein